MSKSLLIRMSIPLPTQSIVPVSSFTFHYWLPMTEDEFITVCDDDITLTFWFDMTCLSHVTPIDEGELSNHVNVLAGKVYVDVTVSDLAEELVDFIMHTDYYRRDRETQNPRERRLLAEYGSLGKRVYAFTIHHVNRLISYARVQKGQYWLEQYREDTRDVAGAFMSFAAKARTDNADWVRWKPFITYHINVPLMDASRFISRDDWEKAGEFVRASSRPPLVGELLAGAESLAGNGYRRSALTEAVTALEVAVAEFSRQPQADQAFGSVYADRMDVTALKNQVNHLGLSATVRYLLPLLFTEEQIPTETLNACQTAVTRRQMIVHEGQRDVRAEELSNFLSSIRQLCSVLESYKQTYEPQA
jgi:hypothetical protein